MDKEQLAINDYVMCKVGKETHIGMVCSVERDNDYVLVFFRDYGSVRLKIADVLYKGQYVTRFERIDE